MVKRRKSVAAGQVRLDRLLMPESIRCPGKDQQAVGGIHDVSRNAIRFVSPAPGKRLAPQTKIVPPHFFSKVTPWRHTLHWTMAGLSDNSGHHRTLQLRALNNQKRIPPSPVLKTCTNVCGKQREKEVRAFFFFWFLMVLGMPKFFRFMIFFGPCS